METSIQLDALNNSLSYFGLKNINIHEKQYSDKRKKVRKFFLQKGEKRISPLLTYNEMHGFILGIGTMERIRNNKSRNALL